ncbi:DUF2268 domain-containing putative Zn-dependent protease [Paenibacillus tianjinensis]|uniref:DUF2268 domain-containing protein n=1 Tax=Paenibacillus tianjinensis TaxID=2810347 RepID=A0ABX7LCE1_9BACL|nr:DUF2268 domain-containing putative Zn-dependent protease [Paenibacillus tianjinensis]QSF45048.1 hypothetical protein JRJ22_28615 [Paenibacillus tianjinensis]
MEIEIICPFKNAWKYIDEMKKGNKKDSQLLWDAHLIQPYWDRISQWAPFDQSFMKPAGIEDLDTLEQQLKLLAEIDVDNLKSEFIRISRELPKHDEDPIIAAIYPNNNELVKARQNGVAGACVFGNIMINVNPLADNWEEWIPYVFGHEYHHSVWGHHWYVLNGGLEGNFLEYMINEGQADAFAKSLFPDLQPQWLRTLTESEEIEFWDKIKPILFSTDRHDFDKYMFGDEKSGLPWCVGYIFGNLVVNSYLRSHPQVSFTELIAVHPKEILNESIYKL